MHLSHDSWVRHQVIAAILRQNLHEVFRCDRDKVHVEHLQLLLHKAHTLLLSFCCHHINHCSSFYYERDLQAIPSTFHSLAFAYLSPIDVVFDFKLVFKLKGSNVFTLLLLDRRESALLHHELTGLFFNFLLLFQLVEEAVVLLVCKDSWFYRWQDRGFIRFN